MQVAHWRGGSAPPESGFGGKLENEEAILDTMLASMARGTLPADAWERLNEAAQRDHRVSELAFGFETVSQGKRLKTLPPPVAAEFLFQAAHFFGDVVSDDIGAVNYLERALTVAPTHSASFEKIEHLLQKTEQTGKLAEVYVASAQHRPRTEQAPLLRRAAELFSQVDDADDRVIDLLQQALRLEPADASVRGELEALYLKANRLRDVARLNEQALTSDPPPEPATRLRLLVRIVDVYANLLNEPERALPHVEQLLVLEPTNEGARQVAERLIGIKGLAGRAAAALAKASEEFGTPGDTARYLSVELENTRGARRASPLGKLAKLKAERLDDGAGAFELLEQAIAVDPSDDQLRAEYVAMAETLAAWSEAAKTLGRALTGTRDPVLKAKMGAQLGDLLRRGGDTKRAKSVLSGILAAPEAPAEAVLSASRVLRVLYEEEGDARALCDTLEWIVELEANEDERLGATERLAELATRIGDNARAIAAYERLLTTEARGRALTALARLYAESGDPDSRARLLEEEAVDEADSGRARELLMRAVELRAREGSDADALVAACRTLVERFGPARDVFALLAPVLERDRRWEELARALEQHATLESGRERAQLLSRLGAARVRQRDAAGAIAAFARALESDSEDPVSRGTLEKLMAHGGHRLAAARALAPTYRREGAGGRLLEALEIVGSVAPEVEERLDALREAAELTRRTAPEKVDRLLEIVAHASTESLEHERPLADWTRLLEGALEGRADPGKIAKVVDSLLAHPKIQDEQVCGLAKLGARAHAASGDPLSSIALYQRALAVDTGDAAAQSALRELYARAGRREDVLALEGAAASRADGDAHAGGRAEAWCVHAMELHRHAVEDETRTPQALAATARLALASGDVDLALAALREQRARANGNAAVAVDLEIVRVLLSRTSRWTEALAALQSVLAVSPDEPAAHSLAQRLLVHPEAQGATKSLLESLSDRAEDGATRIGFLSQLLDAPSAPEEHGARATWFGRLCDLQRERGDGQAALVTAVRAVRELPEATALWDQAEELARTLSRPDEVAALFEELLARPLGRDLALAIAQRSVQFHDEWFEDSAATERVLEFVLARDPGADWAFNRLKLRLDAAKRWDDLFALYDRTIDSVASNRRAALLEDAALTAKDFADRPDDAIRYLEELVHHRRGDASLLGALERLYDRQARHCELVALLSARLPTLAEGEELSVRERIAALSLDELHDAGAALDVIEPALRTSQREASPEGPWRLVERILASLSASREQSEGHTPLRQRAAAYLRGHYERTRRDADLIGILLVQLETATSPREQVDHHLRIAELYEKLGEGAAALEHVGLAVTLDPRDARKRDRLAELASATGSFEALADFLLTAARAANDPPLCATLTAQACAIKVERLDDAQGAIEVLDALLASSGLSDDDVVAAGRTLERLLGAAGREAERLDVLERVAAAQSDATARRATLGEAGRLATQLAQSERAIHAWQRCLEDDERDAEALDGLVSLLDRQVRAGTASRVQSQLLMEVLDRRARVCTDEGARRDDRVRVARLLADALNRPGDSIAAWRDIERDFGEADDAIAAQALLLRSTKRYADLLTLLPRAAARASDPAARADLLREIGDIQLQALVSPAAAVTTYARALQADPRNAGARAGLRALARHDAHRVAAVETLFSALRTCDDWEGILELADDRFDAAGSDDDKVAVLLETMEIAETRAKDPGLAFEAVRRAFATSPQEPRVQAELARLAEAIGAWRALVDSYEQAIDAVGATDTPLAAQLRAWVGEVLETRLDDPAGALQAYLRVVGETSDIDAASAAVALAGQLERWDLAAGVLVDVARARNAVSPPLLTCYERAAGRAAAWDEATGCLERRVAAGGLRRGAARDFEARLAEWNRDRRGDPASAQAAYRRALAHDDSNVKLLTALAELQRRSPDRNLVATLLKLSTAKGGDLALLREATEIARDSVGDPDLARRILSDVVSVVADRCAGTPGGNIAATGEWAIESLARLHEQQGDLRAFVDVLVQGAKLPLEPPICQSMRRRAAKTALERLGDYDLGVDLYLSLFEENVRDEDAVRSLSLAYHDHERPRELLKLRERQIQGAADAAERVSLRLEAARLLVGMGEIERAAEVLRASLADDARHEETVETLAEVLWIGGSARALCELVEDQAVLAEAAGDVRRAVDLWLRAARLAEHMLGAPDAAEGHHARVVALEPREASFDALARLAAARADHASAAGWLARLLEHEDPARRTKTLIRLCDALIAAGQSGQAIERLERAVADTSEAEPLRERLASLYRRQSAWASLAALLAWSAASSANIDVKRDRLLEAATLHFDACQRPDLAIPLLEQAVSLRPEDSSTRLRLAAAFEGAGRLDEARTVLQTIVTGFGRRRSRERALVHHRLALLELAAGNGPQALVELEVAASIDQDNPDVLRALAETARDAGQLARSEKTYRALLDLCRREDARESVGIARSDILFEIHSLAEKQGDAARATEIWESAIQASAREKASARLAAD